MSAPPRRALALVAALAALALATSTASAFTVSISPAGSQILSSLGTITFEGGVSARCPVSLHGELSRGPISIRSFEQIGRFIIGFTSACEGGSIREFDFVTDWRETINSVPGGLPNETHAIELLINRFRVKFATLGGFVECLYEGNVPISLALTTTGAGTYNTGLATTLTNSLLLVEGSFGCPSRVSLRGSWLMTLEALTIR